MTIAERMTDAPGFWADAWFVVRNLVGAAAVVLGFGVAIAVISFVLAAGLWTVHWLARLAGATASWAMALLG
jgi:hypothetical protein